MNYTTYWVAAHRNVFLALLGIFLWIFANYWYLRRDIKRWQRNAKAHSWVADMATKTGKGGRGAPH